MSLVWFGEVDFLKCSRSASQLSFTNLLFRQPKKNFITKFILVRIFLADIISCLGCILQCIKSDIVHRGKVM